MEIYLIRHGQTVDPHTVADPYSPGLTEEGLAQSQRVAEQCEAWGIQFLCASTMRRAEQTADAITARLPAIVRWDLQELEDLTLDDLLSEPNVGHRVESWNTRQLMTAYRNAWTRVMAALARILIYAEATDLERIAIVGHESTLALLLLNWLGLDWRALEHLTLRVDPGASCKVSLRGDEVRIDWVNQI